MKRLSRLAVLASLGPLVLSAATDRITGPVDFGRTATLRGQRHSQAIPRNDRGPADPARELRYITLIV